jgi:TolB-like protein/DNA-binding SARP family transcriptional activator
LLGGFELRGPDGRAIELPTRKCELLLAYLAMPAGQPHARDKLAGLFWGDRGDEQARGSLRKALSALRAALGTEALQVDRDAIALDPAAVAVDADRLARLAADPHNLADAPADDLGCGTFLDGKSLPGSELSDWLTFERTRCRTLGQAVLGSAAERLAAEGRHREALALAQRLLSLDTLREQSHRLLMRLYLAIGERSMARAQYNDCRDLLRKELGVEPSTETVRLAGEISAARADLPAAPSVDPLPTPERTQAAQPWSGGRPPDLSIAVLPFVNKSGDPAQDYFAEGLSDDLLTQLSHQKDFLVIARQSSFRFAGNLGSAASAAVELGVRYVLSGSLRRAGGRLRINAQLTDAIGNRCIWAEPYDRPDEDVFDLQDEVVARIVGSIDAGVRLAEREGAARKHPESLDAWELFHRGMWHIYRFTPRETAIGEECFEKATALAPGFALAHAGLGYAAYLKVTWHFVEDVASTLAGGIGSAETALALHEAEAFSHVVLGRLCTLSGEVPRALRHLIRATELNQNFAQAHFGLAQALFWAGEPTEALRRLDQAERLSPRDPLASMFMTLRSFCCFWLGDLVAAEAAARRAASLESRETWSRLALAAALVELGRQAEATTAVAEARKMDPSLTITSFDFIVGHVPEAMRERVYVALRSAGLPPR